jgi:tetratricopeptide (TPR) repeat protein
MKFIDLGYAGGAPMIGRRGSVPRIDSAWWTASSFDGQPMTDILAARDFGKVFAFLRHRGWSVGALSAATQIDEYRVREIIKGKRQIVAYGVIERVVLGLGIERHLCGIGVGPVVAGHDDPGVDQGVGELWDWLDRARVVDAGTLFTLVEQTDHIRRIDRALGAHAAQPQLLGHLETLRSLRSFSTVPSMRERLADLICDAAALAGWIALDLGDVARAWRCHEEAKDAGREAGSVTALAHALAQQAYVLLEAGRHNEARQLAEHAVGVAGRAVPAVLAAWLQGVAAEIAATSGDLSACRRYFDHAARRLPADAADPSVPYIVLDEYHLARWRGSAFARVGDDLAIAQLQYALAGIDPSFVRARAQLHVELAHAFLAGDEVDEARREVAEARSLALRVGSARQRRRVGNLELQLHQAGC